MKTWKIVRQLRHKGAFASDQCGIHIHVDASRYTPQTLRNLVNIIASKEDILYKALQIDPARLRWCKKTNEQLIQTINKRKPKTMEELKDDKEMQQKVAQALSKEKLNVAVEIKDNTCIVNVFDKKDEKKLANEIMKTVSEVTNQKYFIEVTFK